MKDRGELDAAMALLKEKEKICRQLGDPAGLQASLGNQALILQARGDLDGAMALHKEREKICRQLGDPAGLARSLANQALLLARVGRLTDARSSATEALRLAQRHGLAALARQIHTFLDSIQDGP